MISWFVGLSPTLGSVLAAQTLEPALDSVSLGLASAAHILKLDSVSPSLCPSPVRDLSLSRKGKERKGKERKGKKSKGKTLRRREIEMDNQHMKKCSTLWYRFILNRLAKIKKSDNNKVWRECGVIRKGRSVLLAA